MSTQKTLFQKVWENHVVVDPQGEPTVLYIDLQLLHEVTSPQAFEGLRLAGRSVRRRLPPSRSPRCARTAPTSASSSTMSIRAIRALFT